MILLTNLPTFLVFFLKNYLFSFEREHACTCGSRGGAERQREREKERMEPDTQLLLSMEPDTQLDMGLNPMTLWS